MRELKERKKWFSSISLREKNQTNSAGNGYVLECVNQMCSVRSQAAPGTTITSFNLKTLFSGTDSFGGEWFSFSYLFLLSFFLSYSSVSHIYLSLPATIAIPLPPTNKKRSALYLQSLRAQVDRHGLPAGKEFRFFLSLFLLRMSRFPPRKTKNMLRLSLSFPQNAHPNAPGI